MSNIQDVSFPKPLPSCLCRKIFPIQERIYSWTIPLPEWIDIVIKVYSYLKASMGSLAEALAAGATPKIMPTRAETETAMMTLQGVTVVVT